MNSWCGGDLPRSLGDSKLKCFLPRRLADLLDERLQVLGVDWSPQPCIFSVDFKTGWQCHLSLRVHGGRRLKVDRGANRTPCVDVSLDDYKTRMIEINI